MGIETEGTTDGGSAAIAGGEDVDVGVADHDGFGWDDGASGDCGGFGDEDDQTVRVGFFGVEAVAAVALEEEWRDAEVVADGPGGVDGLVGEDGHEGSGERGADCFE